jgi:asparagine synthase (glutamine-hydrolysing)
MAVKGGTEPESLITKRSCQDNLISFENSMMYLDAVTYLSDDILTKVDRAAMGVSLESRVPMLDHRLVEFAWRLPLDMKIRNGQGKWALRQMLYRHVPQDLIDRPKAGFGLPVGDWLRGPLREWAELLLGEDRLVNEGFFNPEPIRKSWEEHLSGRYNKAYHLWDVLMFQSWLEQERVNG